MISLDRYRFCLPSIQPSLFPTSSTIPCFFFVFFCFVANSKQEFLLQVGHGGTSGHGDLDDLIRMIRESFTDFHTCRDFD